MPNIDPGDVDFLTTKIIKNLQAPPPGLIAVWGYLGTAPSRSATATPVAMPPAEPAAAEPADAAPAAPVAGGTAATDIYWRLYRTPLFTEYLEFRDADVVHYQKVREADDWAGTVVWLKEGAPINYVRSETLEAQRGFLQGDIAGSAAAGQPGMPGGAGGSFLCNAAGLGGTGVMLPTGACAGGAGGSFLCSGAGFFGSFLCGGGGGSFMCNGAGGSFMCGGAGGSFVFC